MFGKKKDGFKSGELEKTIDRITARQDREQKRLGFSDEQYGRYSLEKDRFETAKNNMRTLKRENKK